MTRSILLYIVFVLPLILLAACNDAQQAVTSKISGKEGEVLIVSSVDIQHTALRDTLEALLRQEYPYIPQSEPTFTTIFVTQKAFTNVLQPFRNIIMLHFNADSVHPSMYRQKDKWANGQRILSFYATDQRALAEYVGKNKKQIIALLEEFERSRLQVANNALKNQEIIDSVHAFFGLKIIVPQGYKLRRAAKDFRWYSIETPDISQGLLLYKYKLNGRLPWIPDSIQAHRNKFTALYVPGPNAGTYMQVSTVIPPEYTLLKKGNDTVCFVRGFWEVKGHPMGGSYISYSRLTPARDSMVVTDGYIYAPRFHKRDYMRALDAILQSQF